MKNIERKTDGEIAKSLKEVAYSRIANWLIEGKLQPGEPLVESALASRLEIGRTPVREAIQKLAQEGLVEIFPRRGAFVARSSLKDIQELFEIREALEGIAARLAALRSSPDELRLIKERFDDAGREIDNEKRQAKLEEVGDDLHDLILRTCDNRWITQIINTYKLLLQRERRQAAMIPGRIDLSAQEHRAILGALISSEPEKSGTGDAKTYREYGQKPPDIPQLLRSRVTIQQKYRNKC